MAEYDELVKRLKEAAAGPPTASTLWLIEEAAAAIQALQQQGQWQLKPLEWLEDGEGAFVARTDMGKYRYGVTDDGSAYWTGLDFGFESASDIDAARAAAEAQYEQDVRDEYFLPPPPTT